MFRPAIPVLSAEDQALERAFVLLLAGYFALQILVRVLLPGGLGLDEAEQVYNHQALRLGYGIQPPLYSWLQWLFFGLFGVNVFALALLKNLLLFLTYLLVYLLGRRLVDVPVAVTGAAAMLLLPQVGWESQRDLTHSVLLMACMAGILWMTLRLYDKPTLVGYAILGLLFAAAFQAKYSFAPLALAVLAVTLSPSLRGRLWRREAWVAVIVGIVASLPHGVWMIDRLPQLLASTAAEIVELESKPSMPVTLLEGIENILWASVSFAALPLLVFAFSGPRAFLRRPDFQAPGAAFLFRFFTACYLFLLLTVTVGGVSEFKSRWLQPFLFLLPLALLLAWPGLQDAAVQRRIRGVTVAVAMLILVAIPARALLGPGFDTPPRSQLPYQALFDHLDSRFPHLDLVFATRRGLAGNLLRHDPDLRLQVVDDPFPLWSPTEADAIFVAPKHDARAWTEWLAEQGLTTVGEHTVQLPLPRYPETSIDYLVAVLAIPSEASSHE
jgi:hypothetical protein